jgi:hypothetical protein
MAEPGHGWKAGTQALPLILTGWEYQLPTVAQAVAGRRGFGPGVGQAPNIEKPRRGARRAASSLADIGNVCVSGAYPARRKLHRLIRVLQEDHWPLRHRQHSRPRRDRRGEKDRRKGQAFFGCTKASEDVGEAGNGSRRYPRQTRPECKKCLSFSLSPSQAVFASRRTSKLTGWPQISPPMKSDRIGHSGPATSSRPRPSVRRVSEGTHQIS